MPAHSVIWLFLVDALHAPIDPLYNDALKREIDKIAAAIPHDELAIQFDVASAVFACVDFFYQLPAPAGTGAQFIWLDTGVFRRAQGLFYEASTLGNFCAFFVVMTAVALVRRVGNRLVLVAGGAVFTAALFFSYSR